MINKNIISFSFSVQGYSHIRQEKICEDFSCSLPDNMNLQLVNNSSLRIENNEEINKMRICIVADGHGSDNYPRACKGSKFAVNSAKECIIDLLNALPIKELEDIFVNDEQAKGEKYNLLFKNLSKMILKRWHQYIKDDFKKKNFTFEELEKVNKKYKDKYVEALNEYKKTNIPSVDILNDIAKAYGTTLICFVMAENFCLGLQIGDGKCVMLNRDGTFCEPIPWDDNCHGNVTTSLSDTDAIDNDEFRFFFSKEIPIAVFCGSDGVDDSYGCADDLYAFYRWICMNFIEYEWKEALDNVEQYLPIMSKNGSADDISIAGIVDIDKLKNIKEVLYQQSKKYKENKNNNVKDTKCSAMAEKYSDANREKSDSVNNSSNEKIFSIEQQNMINDFKKMDKKLLDNEKGIEKYEQKKEEYEQTKKETLNMNGIIIEEYDKQ